MANKRISDLSQNSANNLQSSDLIPFLDINADMTGKEELRSVSIGSLGSFMSVSVQGDVVSLSQSIAQVSQSNSALSAKVQTDSASFSARITSTSSSLSSKLNSSLTGSVVSYGIPSIGPDGRVYPSQLPTNSNSVTSVFGRTGNVTPLEADYQSFYLRYSGGSMTGPITLSGNPTDSFHAVPKTYSDSLYSASILLISNNSSSISTLSGSFRTLSSSFSQTSAQTSASLESTKAAVNDISQYISGLAGGLAGEVLVKNSSTNKDYSWVNIGISEFAFYPSLTPEGTISINQGFVNSIGVEGTDPTAAIWTTGSNNNLYWVKVSVDSGTNQAVSAIIETGSVLPANSGLVGYQPLFLLNSSGSIRSLHVRSSLRHEYSGSNHYFYSL